MQRYDDLDRSIKRALLLDNRHDTEQTLVVAVVPSGRAKAKHLNSIENKGFYNTLWQVLGQENAA